MVTRHFYETLENELKGRFAFRQTLDQYEVMSEQFPKLRMALESLTDADYITLPFKLNEDSKMGVVFGVEIGEGCLHDLIKMQELLRKMNRFEVMGYVGEYGKSEDGCICSYEIPVKSERDIIGVLLDTLEARNKGSGN